MDRLFVGSGSGRRLGGAGQPDFQAVSNPHRDPESKRLIYALVKFFDNLPDGTTGPFAKTAAEGRTRPILAFRHAVCTQHNHQGACSIRLNGSPRILFDMSCSVAGLKKKLIVFLITVALGSGVLVVYSAQPATNGTGLENSKLDPHAIQAESQADSLLEQDPNFFDRPDYNLGGGELFFRAMLAVLFVVVLGVAAIYVSRKLLPRIANLPGKEIRIVETVHLGPRKAVHVLEMGDRRFLIGSTNENITKLADITRGSTASAAKETQA